MFSEPIFFEGIRTKVVEVEGQNLPESFPFHAHPLGVPQEPWGPDGSHARPSPAWEPNPACLEGNAQPTQFARSWRHAAAIFNRSGRSLLPYELLAIADRELASPKFTNECTAAYLGTVRAFIVDNVAHRLARIRKARGMFDALEESKHWDEETDLTMGASRAL
ncbi:hypothetical protein M422DRAFT_266749 [Sphaerobolus stellatus SS14]|uniref:Uncharacterized protein n=1 Tax=Sphaerobolus stellatus (strain SS14) TaxID=990650 RepID=A0A0C9V1Q4_SPHS4|nr:hypothetical protein M422DRAFT_266749 [Sphaerobolus stellatus SS14]